jgi:hypothetical protein
MRSFPAMNGADSRSKAVMLLKKIKIMGSLMIEKDKINSLIGKSLVGTLLIISGCSYKTIPLWDIVNVDTKYHKEIIGFYENGVPRGFRLPNNLKLNNGAVLKAGTIVEFYANSQIKQYTLAMDWKTLFGPVCKTGTTVEYYTSGKTKRFALAGDWTGPNGATCKSGTAVEYFENGEPKHFTLALDWNPNERVINGSGWANEIPKKSENRKMSLANNWKPAFHLVLQKETTVDFYSNGEFKQYTLANDWDHPSGAVLKANTQIICDPEGYALLGMLAQDFHRENVKLPSGSRAAIIYNGGNFEVVDADSFSQKSEIRLKKGIHMIISDDKDLIQSIKTDTLALWKYREKDYYRHFDDSTYLDDRLKKQLNTLKEGEISEPFQLNGHFLIIQKMGI